MEIYTKEKLKSLLEKIDTSTYYMPKSLFDGYPTVRLETKLAYVAILDTLVKKPTYSKEGTASIKMDNPEMIKTLSALANKSVDQEKMNKYIEELVSLDLLECNKQDLMVVEV